jgi:sugar lactone lactonase YvrE
MDGSLSNKRVFLRLDDVESRDPAWGWEVGPDGLAVDGEGNVYVAEYGAGHVLIVDDNAMLLATIDVPEPYVTAPALSPDGSRIFITAPLSLYDPTAAGSVYQVANPLVPAP